MPWWDEGFGDKACFESCWNKTEKIALPEKADEHEGFWATFRQDWQSLRNGLMAPVMQ